MNDADRHDQIEALTALKGLLDDDDADGDEIRDAAIRAVNRFDASIAAHSEWQTYSRRGSSDAGTRAEAAELGKAGVERHPEYRGRLRRRIGNSIAQVVIKRIGQPGRRPDRRRPPAPQVAPRHDQLADQSPPQRGMGPPLNNKRIARRRRDGRSPRTRRDLIATSRAAETRDKSATTGSNTATARIPTEVKRGECARAKRRGRAALDSSDEEMMNKPKKHADNLIEMLATAIEAQSAPWQKPWKCDARLPTNLVTGKIYTRRNLLMLTTVRALKGYDDHRWAGFPQIKSVGGHVRRGEHGHWICIMRTAGGSRSQAREEADLDPTAIDPMAESTTDTGTREYTYTTFQPVWNAAQCENITPLEVGEPADEGEHRRILAGEAYLAGTPARVDIRRRNGACYRSRSDEVLLPRREQFDEPVGFYQTAPHELAHATEHESRLDRHLDENRFGAAQYIREELVAKGGGVPGEHERRPRAQPGRTPAGDP